MMVQTSDASTDETPQPTTLGSIRSRMPRRPLSRVGIQSKLLVMLLITSVLSAAVVGVIGYESGRNSLRTSVFDRLTEIREARVHTIEAQVADLKNSLIVYSRGSTATDAVEAYTAGFDQLAAATITPAQQQAITGYYDHTFATARDEQTGNSVDVDALMPTSTAQRYLQALYTAPPTNADAAIKEDDAHDGSAWSAANARYNDFFAEIVTRFNYRDALLLDTRGNVVYSAHKGIDLGTNILTGPYRAGNLTEAYQKAIASNDVDYVGLTDFGNYQPADQPTAWLVSPVGAPGSAEGVLALQFPISRITLGMTDNRQWAATGLGQTGETFLVGADDLMRSDSRLFLQDPQAFKQNVIAAGTPPDVAEQSIRQKSNVLVQPVASAATRLAAQGQSGTLIVRDYLGHDTLQAYGPVHVPGLHWSVVAKIDTSEAFAPVAVFTRKLVLSTIAIIFVVCLASMWLAGLFVRPIRRLEAGAQRISSGDYHLALPVESGDEFGELTATFNDMSRNLSIKEDLLNEQRKDNDQLLLTLMPERVARRYRDGEETIAQDHQDVTVLFADTSGLDEMSATMPSEDALALVNQLVHQFDSSTAELGVERVRTLRNGYLASCGLNVPRLDNVRRTVDLAVAMQKAIDRFNAETDHHLELRIGIDTGTVTSGLIGRSNVVYDMWGSAVKVASRIQHGSPAPGTYVTTRVYDAMRDTWQFTPAGEITVDGVREPIWRLAPTQP